MITIVNNDINSEWRKRFKFVDGIEIIKNNDTTVEIGLSKASIIGLYCDVWNTNGTPTTIEFQYGINGQYFDYCIIDRKITSTSVIDTPTKLVLTLPKDGQFSYAIDRFIKADTLKLIQTSNTDANVSVIIITDSIW